MDRSAVQIRTQVEGCCKRGRDWAARVPAKVWIMLGLFLIAAILMALHTALSGKDASLRVTLQHGFRSADLSVWIDGDLSYAGKLRGTVKKRLGVIPGSVQGNFSGSFPLTAGRHQIRVRVEEEGGATQEEKLTGDFATNTERNLSVTARADRLSLAWQATSSSSQPSGPGWLARYAGAAFLTIGGSIISALTGFALRELPSRIRPRVQSTDAKAQSAAAGQ